MTRHMINEYQEDKKRIVVGSLHNYVEFRKKLHDSLDLHHHIKQGVWMYGEQWCFEMFDNYSGVTRKKHDKIHSINGKEELPNLHKMHNGVDVDEVLFNWLEEQEKAPRDEWFFIQRLLPVLLIIRENRKGVKDE